MLRRKDSVNRRGNKHTLTSNEQAMVKMRNKLLSFKFRSLLKERPYFNYFVKEGAKPLADFVEEIKNPAAYEAFFDAVKDKRNLVNFIRSTGSKGGLLILFIGHQNAGRIVNELGVKESMNLVNKINKHGWVTGTRPANLNEVKNPLTHLIWDFENTLKRLKAV